MDVLDVLVLDGGFATQLSTRVDQTVDGTPLWSSGFLATDPQACLNTHLDFLQAGAGAISANTYQASVDGFVRYLEVSPEEAEGLIRLAVRLAKDAVRRFLQERNWSAGGTSPAPLVVGSVGPYGAALHDGSEYTGAYADSVSVEELMAWHRPRMRVLVDEGVDLLALETLPAQKEAEALVALLAEFPQQKAWISFSCKDECHVAHGEELAEAVASCVARDSNKQVVAYGCNCVAPSLVTPLLNSVRKRNTLKNVPFVTYPNSGEVYSIQEGRWQPGTQCPPLEKYVSEWLDLGVQYIGGCCRTYPPHITRIVEAVAKWKLAKTGE